MAIQEDKNLKTLDFDEFIGSLIAHEEDNDEITKIEDNVISRRDL
jgi:hypothetical protein